MLVSSLTLDGPFHGFFQFFSLWTSLEKSIDSSGNKSAFKLRKLPSLKVICFPSFSGEQKAEVECKTCTMGEDTEKIF